MPFSKNFARSATPNNVPVVSNKFTKRKEEITAIMDISNAALISSFSNIGAILGGEDKNPLKDIKPNN